MALEMNDQRLAHGLEKWEPLSDHLDELYQ